MRKKNKLAAPNKDYLSTSPITGLSLEEALARREEGLGNVRVEKSGKGYGDIIKNNVCNFFTIFLYFLALVFLIFGALLKRFGYPEAAEKYFGFSKFGYLIPLTANIVIGSITEIRSKRALDKMKLVNAATVNVIRDGQSVKAKAEELVLGDVVIVNSGTQILADGVLLEGDVEVDESLLSGESAPVRKRKNGDELFSGSFVVSGSAKMLLTKVGDDTYASQLSNKVKKIQTEKSELMRNIYGLLNILSFVLMGVVVLVVVTMCVKISIHGQDPTTFPTAMSLNDPLAWAQIVSTASAFAIGVIPTGLVLVTSMSLAISIIELSKQKTLVQDLFSLENLARVDIICLDKTGTLTDGTMELVASSYYVSKDDADSYLGILLGSSKSSNATSNALKAAIKSIPTSIREEIPFSSARKFSGVVLKSGKEILLGAPEYLCKAFPSIQKEAEEKQKEGLRALALVFDGVPQALYFLSDRVRPSAKDTISYFYENGVDVKIISGDSPLTVSKIASICGVKNTDKAISLEGKSLEETEALAEDYVIFARVSPEQKEVLVSALQKKGHKVAMTGDGVNDALALRKANASITFARATDAAKACSDVVLMDNDFSHLVDVVTQGRRVVNNIQRSAVLFLTKTVFIMNLALFTIPFKAGQMLFTIENVYLFEQAVIGIGGFFLSLENSKKRIEGTFKEKVFPSALSGGTMLLITIMIPLALNQLGLLSVENTATAISILTLITSLSLMAVLSFPFSKYRVVVFAISLVSSIIFALAAPTSYLGGAPTTFGMIFGDGHEFWHEFFQPWNSPVFVNIEKESWVCWLFIADAFLSAPGCILMRLGFEKIFETIDREKKKQLGEK